MELDTGGFVAGRVEFLKIASTFGAHGEPMLNSNNSSNIMLFRCEIVALVLATSSLPLLASGLQAPAEPNGEKPGQWLDALNRSICGQRWVNRHSAPDDLTHLFLRAKSSPLAANATDWPPGLEGDQYEQDDDEANYEKDYGSSIERDANWSRWWQNRASAGYDAQAGEIPWFVRLTIFYGWLGLSYRVDCGGILIHKTLVLTAAHCLMQDDGSRAQVIWVRLGLYDWNKYQTRQEKRFVQICHPRTYKPDQVWHDDVALIKLSSPVRYNKYVQPACLTGDDERGSRPFCLSAGMGKTDGDSESQTLKAMPVKSCGGVVNFDQWCYISADQEAQPGSFCEGDSGSGVYCTDRSTETNETQFFAVGVISNKRAEACRRGVISRVHYSDLYILQETVMELAEQCK